MAAPMAPRAANQDEQVGKQSKKLEEQVEKIVQLVAAGLENQTNQANKDVLLAYAEILKSASQLETALPKNRAVSFRLTTNELKVLFIYAAGGILMMLVARLILGVELKAQDLVNVLLYWSSIVAILLGAQALPQILGKGSSADAATSKNAKTS